MARKLTFKQTVERLKKTIPDLTPYQMSRAIKTLKSTDWRDNRRTFRAYWQMMQVHHGIQVVRTFSFRVYNYKRKANPEPQLEAEVMQIWFGDGGQLYWNCMPVNSMGYYYDAWCRAYDMRKCPIPYGSYYGGAYYRFSTVESVYVSSVLPRFKYCGFDNEKKLQSLKCPWFDMQTLMIDPIMETLYRSNDKQDRRWWNIINETDIHYAKAAITAMKICRRHKYDVKDVGIWRDLIKALSYLKLDLHNPFYVCPADLNKMHDVMVKRMGRLQEERERTRAIKRAAKFEESYKKLHGKYIGLMVQNENINIYTCPSVADMAQEGKAMHHCVYRMAHYKKKDSIILFVRNKKDERVSTMELSLSNWNIIQNRGVNNSVPMYYNEANKLVMDNIKLFKNAGKKQKAKVISINQPLTQAA